MLTYPARGFPSSDLRIALLLCPQFKVYAWSIISPGYCCVAISYGDRHVARDVPEKTCEFARNGDDDLVLVELARLKLAVSMTQA
jgi:hypothetical protein